MGMSEVPRKDRNERIITRGSRWRRTMLRLKLRPSIGKIGVAQHFYSTSWRIRRRELEREWPKGVATVVEMVVAKSTREEDRTREGSITRVGVRWERIGGGWSWKVSLGRAL